MSMLNRQDVHQVWSVEHHAKRSGLGCYNMMMGDCELIAYICIYNICRFLPMQSKAIARSPIIPNAFILTQSTITTTNDIRCGCLSMIFPALHITCKEHRTIHDRIAILPFHHFRSPSKSNIPRVTRIM